eukprot:2027068-Amphidinium_carterae.1
MGNKQPSRSAFRICNKAQRDIAHQCPFFCAWSWHSGVSPGGLRPGRLTSATELLQVWNRSGCPSPAVLCRCFAR